MITPRSSRTANILRVQPDMEPLERRRSPARWWLAAAVLVAVAFLAIDRPWTWAADYWRSLGQPAAGDAREYPRPSGPMFVTIGKGDLEKDLLPYFDVTLPCAATDISFGQDIHAGGATDSLYLRFATTRECLREFLATNRLATSEDAFPGATVPTGYGWVLGEGDPEYSRQTGANRVHVLVEGQLEQPVVFVVARR